MIERQPKSNSALPNSKSLDDKTALMENSMGTLYGNASMGMGMARVTAMEMGMGIGMGMGTTWQYLLSCFNVHWESDDLSTRIFMDDGLAFLHHIKVGVEVDHDSHC